MEANYFRYCSGFCHTLTWISYGWTCVPHPESPSHIPPHPIPQGHPSASALSALSHASNLDWRSVYDRSLSWLVFPGTFLSVLDTGSLPFLRVLMLPTTSPASLNPTQLSQTSADPTAAGKPSLTTSDLAQRIHESPPSLGWQGGGTGPEPSTAWDGGSLRWQRRGEA